MAILIKTDGSFEPIKLDKSLEQMQKIVDGYIEVLSVFNGYFLIINEEGKVDDLPLNKYASLLYNIGRGHPTEMTLCDTIVGDAIYCTKEEMGE